MSDIRQQFKFENTEKVKLLVIGRSDKSVFDLGIQLSLFSTYNSNLITRYERGAAMGLLFLFLIYTIYLFRSYRRKMDTSQYQEMIE
jgi:Ca2+/Na+ antiporter